MEKRIDIVELAWFMSMGTDVSTIIQVFIDVCSRLLPEALPLRYGSYEPLKNVFSLKKVEEFCSASFEAIDGKKGIGMFFWEAGRPFWNGCLMRSPSFKKLDGNVNYRKLEISCDRKWLAEDYSQSQKLQSFFVDLSKTLGAFYSAGYVIRGVFLRKKLWFGSEVEASPIPKGGVWLGLPVHPTWLTWYGTAYVPYVSDALKGCVTSASKEGIFISHGLVPLTVDDLRSVAPVIPESLQVKMESPPRGLRDSSEYIAAGFTDPTVENGQVSARPKPMKAEMIPDLI